MKHVSWTVLILGACAALLLLVGPARAGDEWFGDPTPHGKNPGGDAGDDAGVDAGEDAGVDAGEDAGIDAGEDAGPTDAGEDAGPTDAGVPDGGQDAGTDGGTHQIRYIGGGCSCGGGTSAALMFGLLAVATISARRRSSKR